MNLKIKIYAFFQFFSLAALVFFLGGIFLLSINATENDEITKAAFWIIEFKSLLKFSAEGGTSFIGSILIYSSFLLVIAAWVIGFLVLSLKTRNYFDTMFLLFVAIPLISNFFCLLAQLFLNEKKMISSRLNKEDMEKEKTQIIKILNEEGILNNKKEKDFENKILKTLENKIKKK